jgi:NAD(P)-dependent dehydrogenase (short-subunit alcohol dehydrogenase family)
MGRSARRGASVKTLCRSRGPAAQIDFLAADLAAQASVKAAAAAVATRWNRIDILVNNAGARYDHYSETEDGLERTFATNHLAHFLLTHLLVRQLEPAGPGRVITISSRAHAMADVSEGWTPAAARYDRRIAYANSKLANILFSQELARRSDPRRVTSYAVDPGVMFSRFASNNGILSWIRHVFAHLIRREIVFPSASADTVVFLGTNPTIALETGGYWHRRERTTPSTLARDRALGRDLWELSERLTKLT